VCVRPLREAWFGPYADRLIIVNYETLADKPKLVLQRIYREINQPWFEHDFENFIC
jgi:sulfotransferase